MNVNTVTQQKLFLRPQENKNVKYTDTNYEYWKWNVAQSVKFLPGRFCNCTFRGSSDGHFVKDTSCID